MFCRVRQEQQIQVLYKVKAHNYREETKTSFSVVCWDQEGQYYPCTLSSFFMQFAWPACPAINSTLSYP